MSGLREAAQQALEALEESLYATTDKSQFLAFEAITALKAALAEPEPRNQCGETCERAKLCAVCARALAEPVQEPVAAWENKYGMKEWEVHALRAGWMPAPPQRKPLTEEEIGIICASLGFAQISPVEVARAIERAYGITS